jgi:hypothetical protein
MAAIVYGAHASLDLCLAIVGCAWAHLHGGIVLRTVLSNFPKTPGSARISATAWPHLKSSDNDGTDGRFLRDPTVCPRDVDVDSEVIPSGIHRRNHEADTGASGGRENPRCGRRVRLMALGSDASRVAGSRAMVQALVIREAL